MVFSFNTLYSLLPVGKHVHKSPKNIFPMLVETFTLNGWLNQMMFLFLVLFLFLSFLSSLSSLTGVFISPVAWFRFVLTAFSCGFSFFLYFNFCLCLVSLSATLYGFAALLKILTLAELFERHNSIPFDKFFNDGRWMVAITVDIADCAVCFFYMAILPCVQIEGDI